MVEIRPVSVKSLDEKKQKLFASLTKSTDADLFVYFFDLNNDSIEDNFVFYTAKGECPRAGCKTSLFLSKYPDIYDEFPFKYSMPLSATYILRSMTNNVHDLMFSDRSLLAHTLQKTCYPSKEVYIKKEWDGKQYQAGQYLEIDFSAIVFEGE